MKHVIASFAVLTSASQFLCLFCCIVPTATGILAILTSFGVGFGNSLLLGDIARTIHPWQPYILGGSITLISISWSIWFYGQKRSHKLASADGSACGCHSNSHIQRKPIFLIVATGLLTFNLVYSQMLHG